MGNEHEQLEDIAKRLDFTDHMMDAFVWAPGGLPPTMAAIQMLNDVHAFPRIPKILTINLSYPNSNFIKHPYVHERFSVQTQKIDDGGHSDNSRRSPYNQQHAALINRLDDRFRAFVPYEISEDDGIRISHDRIMAAAMYKIAALLATIEQLAFEAKAVGKPYAKSYVPSGDNEKWDRMWQEHFGIDTPTLPIMYKLGHAMFVKYADSTNPDYAYLFAITNIDDYCV